MKLLISGIARKPKGLIEMLTFRQALRLLGTGLIRSTIHSFCQHLMSFASVPYVLLNSLDSASLKPLSAASRFTL